MAVEPRLMTSDDLLALPADHKRHELIKGELRKMSPASDPHGDWAGAIHGHIFVFLFGNPIARVRSAETGFRLSRDPDTVRAPDVAVVRVERLPPEGAAEGYFEGAPDLAVEIVSPRDSAND